MFFGKIQRTLASAGVLAILVSAGPASAANLVKTFKDWNLFTHSENDKKICFAATQPKQTLPKGVKRDAIFFYVSAWPKDGIKSEISIRMGYPVKSGSTVKVSVGSNAFELFAKEDRAFVADPTDELKLIETMKKGSFMQVEATSKRGTRTSDRYSLIGVSAALSALTETCP